MSGMRHWRLFVVCLALLTAALSIDKPRMAGAAPMTGILSGRVTRGPLSPVEIAGRPDADQVVGAQIDIRRSDGTRSFSVKTDPNGAYNALLPPGTYTVTMPSLYGAMFNKDLPATVTIVSGQQTRLDIHLDTGIR